MGWRRRACTYRVAHVKLLPLHRDVHVTADKKARAARLRGRLADAHVTLQALRTDEPLQESVLCEDRRAARLWDEHLHLKVLRGRLVRGLLDLLRKYGCIPSLGERTCDSDQHELYVFVRGGMSAGASASVELQVANGHATEREEAGSVRVKLRRTLRRRRARHNLAHQCAVLLDRDPAQVSREQ